MATCKLILVCTGVQGTVWHEAASCVEEEFAHRPYHQNVRCTLLAGSLILTAENDFDSTGLALSNEFSDAITACISGGFGGMIEVWSVIAT